MLGWVFAPLYVAFSSIGRAAKRLLARRPEGVFVNAFERGELGPDLFRAARTLGLEGLVSKRRDPPYQAGRNIPETWRGMLWLPGFTTLPTHTVLLLSNRTASVWLTVEPDDCASTQTAVARSQS